ncbi:MAG: disulfide bond formation protein B [Rhizomicrobium sp.]
MTRCEFAPDFVAMLLGAAALALIAGALGFEYLARLPPCEMCMWQRYPHFAAAIVGIGGFLLIRTKLLPASAGIAIAMLAASLIAVSGAIGVYHAGVEWQWWKGPQACTGTAFQSIGATLDLNAPIVRCDRAAWRLFGISLAGYNALFSFVIALAGARLLARPRRTS